MNKQQFLLLKLMEECAEVAQRASKQFQFGKDERQKDHAPHGAEAESKSNGERLRDEIMDLMVLVTMLEETKEIPQLNDFPNAYIAKKIKLQKYLDLSASLGELPEIKL